MFHWSLDGNYFEPPKIQKIGSQNPPKVENHHPKPIYNTTNKTIQKTTSNPHITPPLKPMHVTAKNSNYDG
jgi:hypothetical protein